MRALRRGCECIDTVGGGGREVKIRESGMPNESHWHSFFDPELALDRLMPAMVQGDTVEFGCGYRTFTIPAARRTSGTLHALDIEPSMAELTAAKAKKCGLKNLQVALRDFVAEGTGLIGG